MQRYLATKKFHHVAIFDQNGALHRQMAVEVAVHDALCYQQWLVSMIGIKPTQIYSKLEGCSTCNKGNCISDITTSVIERWPLLMEGMARIG